MPAPALAAAAPALISAGVQLIGGLFTGGKARRAAKRAARERSRLQQKLSNLEANRQEIIDPYAGITDLSDMVKNPFANLQVATQAAEMQAEQTDIALASTLDTLRATGRGAGGATALAQAAARSKQGISASIEQQEARNAVLRAQGEQEAQKARMTEAIRQQSADVAGKQFMFSTRENREMQQLDRTQGLLMDKAAQEAAYKQQAGAAFGSAIGAAGGLALGGLTGAFKGLGGAAGSNPTGALDFFGATSKYVTQPGPSNALNMFAANSKYVNF